MLCGEKLLSLNGSAQSIGSPSRMRGKEGDELGLGQTIRITPAYAGKSKSLPSLHIGSRDHPRVCGEKARLGRFWLSAWGSPPHMRGKGVSLSGHISVKRITPACAGKSHVFPRSAQVQWDHPRVCGEKKKAEEMGATTKGSPPRVRGKAFHPVGRDVGVGITPAYAGKR